MSIEDSVASMTRKQIIESLEIMGRGNIGFHDPKEDVRLENGHVVFAAANLIRGKSADRTSREVVEQLKKMVEELTHRPEWQARRLLFLKAISILEDA